MNENGVTLSGEAVQRLRDKLQEALTERNELASRVADLEQALAPFAELLLTECDDPRPTTLMADTDPLPVPMGIIRQAARAHAGTGTN